MMTIMTMTAQRHILNPIEQNWVKAVNYFYKKSSIVDVLLGFKYASAVIMAIKSKCIPTFNNFLS